MQSSGFDVLHENTEEGKNKYTFYTCANQPKYRVRTTLLHHGITSAQTGNTTFHGVREFLPGVK